MAKKRFNRIDNETEPKQNDYIGEDKHLGRSRKEFSVFLQGEGEGEELEIIRVKLVTPKNRKLLRYIFKASEFEKGYREELEDELLDYIIDNYAVPKTVVEKLVGDSLLELILFALHVSKTPSKD